jgi:hypothetical protein
MAKMFSAFERPILHMVSRAMRWVYIKTYLSPLRQVIAWEALVTFIELLIVGVLVYASDDQVPIQLAVGFLVIGVFKVLDLIDCARKFRSTNTLYDARAYKMACAAAQAYRDSFVGMRITVTLLPFLAFFMFSKFASSYNWMGVAALAYGCLYASKFYVRAAEPPHPDEGDYVAHSQVSTA